MKKNILFCLSLLVLNVQAQDIQNNKANVFTLIIDYDVPVFEGGNLAYFDCLACTNDTLPFEINYQTPSDFGGIEMKLNASQSTFFLASIIWMGNGIIIEPQSFSMTNPFVNQQIHFAFPTNIRLFDEQGSISTSPQLMQEAQNAWTSIEGLEIVRQALENDFHVGMYLYSPIAGMTDWSAAKWIVFLYKNTFVNELSKLLKDVEIYPNPTQNNLQLIIDNMDNNSYEIKSLDGKIVQQANLKSKTISVSNLIEGMYFIEIKENDKLISRLKFQKI